MSSESFPLEKSFSMFTKVDRHLNWIDSHMNYQRCLYVAFRFSLVNVVAFIFIFIVTLLVALGLLWSLNRGKLQ